MQDKVITIPFNYEDFINAQKLIWSLIYKKHLKAYFTYTVLGIVVLWMGIVSDDRKFPLGIIIGGGILFYMLMIWSGFFEKRSKFFKIVKTRGQSYLKEEMTCTYTFSDFGIEYQDSEKTYKLSWHLFRPSFVFRDHIVIGLKDGQSATFIIARHEVGEQNYQGIQDVLLDKQLLKAN